MRTKTFFNYVVAALFCCCVTGMVTSCQSLMDTGSADNPSAENMLKQGVWTEHDTALGTTEYTDEQADALSNPEKYTDEELEAILSSIESIEEPPAVGMMVEGDKAYFFTYSAEGADDLVEGKISYNKDAGTGVIAFPAIKDSPVSGQTVSFKMTSDELMEFELTYEGEKVTGSCAWLCKDLSNWGTESDDAEWKELMAYYDAISAEGPDASASIDWSGSATVTVQDVDDEGNPVEKDVTVTDLDKPLEWNDEVSSARAGTRMAIASAISTGLEVFTTLFEEDPTEEINAKLDAVLGKLDNVLQNQQIMMAKLDEINGRLIEIAQRMDKTEIVNMFNNRNEKYYNKLKVQNTKYFNDAYKAYKANKNDPELANYAKAWVGKNEEFANLTWEYIEYLTTVEHTGFGKGMDRIYDGLVFDKYPWEHIGIGDRKNYRAYDLTMIAKSLFMISLYSTYGGLNNIEQKGLYNSYKDYKPKLKAFSEFKISDPDKFRVCQIKDAHFIMHKEIQKYNYHKYGDSKAPNYKVLDYFEIVFRPEWHEAGSIKIENPKELKSKLIYDVEMKTLYNYYKSAFYSNQDKIWWTKMLVGDDASKQPGGAVLAKPLASPNNTPDLVIVNRDRMWYAGTHEMGESGALDISPVWADYGKQITEVLGQTKFSNNTCQWASYNSQYEYYMAIIEKRY